MPTEPPPPTASPLERIERVLTPIRRFLKKIDPNDDPSAEPLSVWAVLAVLVASAFAFGLYMRFKIQPLQDQGTHVAMAAIVADFNKADSIYPAMYSKFDWLNTNSLLYSTAGFIGRIGAPSMVFRIVTGSYHVLVPLANLYALRVFGRSAWGAVASVPLAYNLSYIVGFSNFLFAAPFAIVAVPLFYRTLRRPTRWRIGGMAILMMLLFLAHAHVFLWTGVLLFLMALAAIAVSVQRAITGRPSTPPLHVIAISAGVVLPALALFGRWYYTSMKLADTLVTPMKMGRTTWADFVKGIPSPAIRLRDLPVDYVTGDEDRAWFALMIVTVFVLAAIRTFHKYRRPPVMELAAAVTLASYFLLPEDTPSQAMIGSRQIGFAAWYASAFFTPVPSSVTRLGRWVGIVLVSWLAINHLSYWHKYLAKYWREEGAGLAAVIDAAPPQKRLHIVNLNQYSKYFNARPFMHNEKWYMIDKRGQDNENPAYIAVSSIHYRSDFNARRISRHTNDWPSNDEIWDYFDIIITHQWKPSPADLARAEQKGERLAKSGDWELWQSRSPKPAP